MPFRNFIMRTDNKYNKYDCYCASVREKFIKSYEKMKTKKQNKPHTLSWPYFQVYNKFIPAVINKIQFPRLWYSDVSFLQHCTVRNGSKISLSFSLFLSSYNVVSVLVSSPKLSRKKIIFQP